MTLWFSFSSTWLLLVAKSNSFFYFIHLWPGVLSTGAYRVVTDYKKRASQEQKETV